MTNRVYSHTQGLCSVCKAKAPAKIVERDGRVHLDKFCPEHGTTTTVISSDPAWYQASLSYVKPRQRPLAIQNPEFKGCPESCGMCSEHQQHTCLPIIEIDNACNMTCPVCLKGDHQTPRMELSTFSKVLDTLFEAEGTLPVVNLSGGEPTLHPLLPQLLDLCSQRGVVQTTVSTNGLRLARDPELRRIFKDTGTLVALQFDGFSETTNLRLRGQEMTKIRLDLIEKLETEGIPYSLVATIAAGINDHEIPRLVEQLFTSRALSLMLQPMSFTGFAQTWDTRHRLTIPDIVRRLEENPRVAPGDFNPLPCSHFSCFALSYYLHADDGQFRSLKAFLGEQNFLELVANKTLPGLDGEGLTLLKGRLFELWSAADTSDIDQHVMDRIRKILRQIPEISGDPRALLELGKGSMKGIFVHDFMDVENMDIGRLMKCCNPYARADGKLVPMCAQNVFFS